MTKEKISTLILAGAVATAAVTGVVGTSDPADMPSRAIVQEASTGSFAESQLSLEEAIERLIQKSGERGMTLPQNPGVTDVVNGMDRMSPSKGTVRQVKVSKEGSITKGDYLRVCREFTTGGSLRFATSGVKIIAACSASSDPYTPADYLTNIAVLFTQDGDTKFKTIQIDHGSNMTMGTTVTILEDEELQFADMTVGEYGLCYIAYNQDGDGKVTAVKCGKNRVNTVLWTGTWSEGGDPENICLTYDNVLGQAAILCTKLPADSIEDDDRYASLLECVFGSNGFWQSHEIVLTPEANPVLTGIDYSVDAYAQGWDVSFAANYYYDRQAWDPTNNQTVSYDYVIFVTYPRESEEGRGLIILDKTLGATPATVKSYHITPVIGSVPSTAMASSGTSQELGQLAITALIHGTSRITANSSVKCGATLSLYAVQREDSKPVEIAQRSTLNKYGTNVSRLCVGGLGKSLFFGYAYNNSMYASVVDLRPNGSIMVFGPELNVATFREYATILPVDDAHAAVIYQTTAGDGYIKILNVDRVVAETTVDQADGVALANGYTGGIIRADMTFWPDE